MTNGREEYKVLKNTFDRESLLEQGKQNGVSWKEDKHDGVNWMRFSNALISHIDKGQPFDCDNADQGMVQQMKDHYHQLRDMHKQTMIPHIRGAMAKLYQDGDKSKSPMDYLSEAYNHLDANGGSVWGEKLNTLHHLNTQIKKLSDKLTGSQV